MTDVFIYGIYPILGGVAAIDFGSRAAPSTVAGILDGAGYLAALGAGWRFPPRERCTACPRSAFPGIHPPA